MRAAMKHVLVLALLAATHPALAAFDSAEQAKAGPLQVIRVTPTGEDVTPSKQITIQFNRPVVAIGKMERSAAEIPVTITPPLPCEWRWINTSALACNLPEKSPMQAATHYMIDMKPGITALDGATIESDYHDEFVTDRPKVNYTQFHIWKGPSLPVLRLSFNQPVEKSSVASHVFLQAGDSRVKLSVSQDPDDTEPSARHGARRVWLVEPNKKLPLDESIVLKAEEGLKSSEGDEVGLADESLKQFDTYPEFAFIGVRCQSNDGNEVNLAPGESVTQKCNPMASIALQFTAPVKDKQAKSALEFEPRITWGKADADDEEEDEDERGYQYRRAHEKGRLYSVYLPNGLKAAQAYEGQTNGLGMNWFVRAWHWFASIFSSSTQLSVHDIFGRSTENAVRLKFETDHRVPNYVLAYHEAVLESQVDSEVPFFVNNLKSYSFNYRKLTSKGLERDQHFSQQVPAVEDIQFAVPFGIRKMLGGASGVVYGTLDTSPRLRQSSKPSLFAQVTPYQVHLKLGHFTSLVWVTDMASGAPVADARVSFLTDSFLTFGSNPHPAVSAVTDKSGVAMLPGTETLDSDLTLTRAYGDEKQRYFVQVSKGDDLAVLPIASNFEIDSYRASGSESVYPSNQTRYGHIRTWGTTAQGIYRAGDTIQYKLFVRNQDNDHLVQPPALGYTLKIIDPMGKVVKKVDDLKLSAFGGFDGEFTVAKEAAVGWYEFKLIANTSGSHDEAEDEALEEAESDSVRQNDNGKDKRSWTAMRVLVSDFTPASFKVSNHPNAERFHAEQTVNITTNAELHSGGAYTDASTRVTAMLDSRTFTSKDPIARDFAFDSFTDEASSQQLFQKIEPLNDKGELSVSFNTGKPNVVYGKLTFESAVADDRGKYIAGQSTVDYIGVDRLVGLRNKEWVFAANKPATFDYIVVNADGKPVSGTSVDIAIEYESSKAARVKGAGNAYTSEYKTEWLSAGSCKGKSKEEAQQCTFTPTKAGVYRAVAKIKDTDGRAHSTTLSTYATGSDFVMWSDESDTSLTIIPQATSYKVGDKARFLVKNPYPGAKALISVERYGVIDHFTQTFDTSTPTIELPIKADYLPGVYVSVVVTSPRVEKPLGEGQVDLGKPAFRMGYIAVPVKDGYKEMAITAKTDKPVYKPREKVTVQLHAEPRVKDKKEPIELTIAVLDESVFDLVTGGKANFDPYDGFYKLESLDLRNYSLLTRLIGRQKFEKKGANPGGDGGADLSMRSLFKFVSYWNGALRTDAAGNATISFDAPDNLTGWRILALASTPTDRFGLGDANFKVNRETEVRPVMPNQVMEGDKFDAGFSVMNRTDKPRDINVTIRVEGNVDPKAAPLTLTKKLSLAPYKREVVRMPIQTTGVVQKSEVTKGNLHFEVTAGDALDKDGMVQDVPVLKNRSLDVAANYGTTTADKVEELIAFPKDMLPDVGSVSVTLSPTVIGNIEGAFAYMRDYPYFCWEQRLSRAVMASHYKNLRAYLPSSLSWKDSDSLPQSTLDNASSFQAPNGGMAYFRAQDSYADPYLSAYTALSFNWLRDSGYKVPEEVEERLHGYLNNLLKNDAMPTFYSEGMGSDVRAVALAALAKHGKVTLSDLDRYAPHMKKMSLFGKTYFLQAAMDVKGGEKYTTTAANDVLAHSNQTGGSFVFSETLDDSYSRILASPLRVNCAVLDAFTKFGERPEGSSLVGDVPFKLVRTITASRKNRDHWENTQENMFCMNALVDFARVYEKDKPTMTVTASLNGAVFGGANFEDVRSTPVMLDHQNNAQDVGKKATLTLDRSGSGRLYYASRLSYALPASLTKPANAGLEIHREYSVERDGKWKLLGNKAEVKRGELVRVDLYVSVPAARNFVVVDDAVPGGLEPVNRNLATSSVVDANKGEYSAAGGSFWFKFSDWNEFDVSRWSFYHQEIRHDSVRFYSDYLSAGNYHLSYTAQAIATGEFNARPARAEEMYDPDVYGTTEGLQLNVEEGKNSPSVSSPVKP